MQKERRHEYETVWVDAEGNELEEPPEDRVAPADKRANGATPKAKAQPQRQRSGRAVRVPSPPSWQRAARRALILGAVIFVLFYILGSKNGHHNLQSALALAALYTAIFVPFSYYMDRFTYNRWQRRAAQQGDRRQQPRKR
jgi:hypothetical protein